MAYDGNGVFNRLYNWQADAAAGINILADRMDAEMDGFATGLSICLTRDGQAAMEAPLDMGGFKLVNLADPTAEQDAVTKKFLETNFAAYLQVGPTPPTTPKMGSLWYRDVAPVGLFMYYTDLDSSQWIQLAGSGLPPNFATQDEARTGTVTDKVMSPARVRDLSGVMNSSALTGLNQYIFQGIPKEATKIDFSLWYAGPRAVGGIAWNINNLSVGYVSNAVRLKASAAIEAFETSNRNSFYIPFSNATDNVLGTCRLVRTSDSDQWLLTGQCRLNGTTQLLLTGSVSVTNNEGGIVSLLVNCTGANFAEGNASLKWRI